MFKAQSNEYSWWIQNISMENIPMAWEKISNLYFTTKNWNTTVKQFLEGKFDGIESLLIYPVLLMLYCVHLVTRPG